MKPNHTARTMEQMTHAYAMIQLEYRLMYYFQEKGIDSDVGLPSQVYSKDNYFSFYIGECAPKYWKEIILPGITYILKEANYRIYTQRKLTEKAFNKRITCRYFGEINDG